MGDSYEFEHIEYVAIFDNFNDKIYLIRTDVDKLSHGVYINVKDNLPIYKLADDDIRNHYPIFNISKFKNREVIFGDVELYKIMLERGVRFWI